MKKTIYIMMFLAVAMFAVAGCAKQEAETVGRDCPMTIQPEVVSADGALTSNDGGATKATLINEAAGLQTQGFGLSLYDGTTALKSKVEMEYTDGAWAPKGGTMDWKWAAGTVYKFYAWSPASLNVGTVTGTGVPAFTYSGIADQKDIMLGYYNGIGNNGAAPVKFSHALASIQFKTGTITGLGNITKIELSGVVTSGTCTPSYSSSSNVGFAWSNFSGSTALTQTGLTVATTASGTAIGAPFLTLPQSAALTVKLTDANSKTVTAAISAPALTAGKTAVYAINYDGITVSFTVTIADWGAGQNEAVTIREEDPVPYVEIAAKYDGTNISTLKWYKENLAISASGKREYNNTGHINGDYFQWATYAGFCGNASDPDKGLLIYSSFTSPYCGDSSPYNFTLKGTKTFNQVSAPYYEGLDPNHPYSSKYSAGSVLEMSDDAANIILGGTWRIPTSSEFSRMAQATFWAWDATDLGLYVFEPTPLHAANTIGSSIPSDLSKEDALLFFPVKSGYVYDGNVLNTSENAYWVRNHGSNNKSGNAYLMNLAQNAHNIVEMGRQAGFHIRPVSN